MSTTTESGSNSQGDVRSEGALYSLAHMLTPEFLQGNLGQMNRRRGGSGLMRESCETV